MPRATNVNRSAAFAARLTRRSDPIVFVRRPPCGSSSLARLYLFHAKTERNIFGTIKYPMNQTRVNGGGANGPRVGIAHHSRDETVNNIPIRYVHDYGPSTRAYDTRIIIGWTTVHRAYVRRRRRCACVRACASVCVRMCTRVYVCARARVCRRPGDIVCVRSS